MTLRACADCIRGTTHTHSADCGPAKHDWRCCTQNDGWLPCGNQVEKGGAE